MNNRRLSLFQNISPDFFRVLAYGAVEDSFDLIVAIDDYFGSSTFEVNREKLVTYLSEYISRRTKEDKKEFDPDEEGLNSNEKARSFLRRLVTSGWLDKEAGEDFTEMVSRSDAFMKIVPVLREIALEDTKTNEYYGLTDNIFRSLQAFDFTSGAAALEQLDKRSQDLTRYLLAINSQIRRFIRRALDKPDQTDKEILETLLDRFQAHPALIALNNLQGKNNPELHHREIIHYLDELMEPENKRAIILNYLETKALEATDENYRLAEDFVNKVNDEIREQYDTMPGFIKSISGRNAMYVQTTKNILEFRLNNSKDIQSAINSCLKIMAYVPDDLVMESPFYLETVSTIDEQSIYKPRLLSKRAPKVLDFVDQEIDEKAYERARSFVKEENRYSKKGLTNFLFEKMEDKEYLEARDVKGQPLETFIRLMLIPSYKIHGFNISDPYDDDFKLGPYRMDNYLIHKLGGNDDAEG